MSPMEFWRARMPSALDIRLVDSRAELERYIKQEFSSQTPKGNIAFENVLQHGGTDDENYLLKLDELLEGEPDAA